MADAKCPQCGRQLQVPDEAFERDCECPACANVFVPSRQAGKRQTLGTSISTVSTSHFDKVAAQPTPSNRDEGAPKPNVSQVRRLYADGAILGGCLGIIGTLITHMLAGPEADINAKGNFFVMQGVLLNASVFSVLGFTLSIVGMWSIVRGNRFVTGMMVVLDAAAMAGSLALVTHLSEYDGLVVSWLGLAVAAPAMILIWVIKCARARA